MLNNSVLTRGVLSTRSFSSSTKPLPLVSRYPRLGRQFSRRYAMSTTLQSHEEPLHLGAQFKGESGRIYKIEEVLADRRKPLLCVYRARYGPFNKHSTRVSSILTPKNGEKR